MKVEPVENYLQSEEWLAILAVMRSVLPAYPDALQSAEKAVACLCTPMERQQVHHALYQALYDFIDARVALAAALVSREKPEKAVNTMSSTPRPTTGQIGNKSRSARTQRVEH